MTQEEEHQWFVVDGERRLGPFTTEELHERIRANRFPRSSRVLRSKGADDISLEGAAALVRIPLPPDKEGLAVPRTLFDEGDIPVSEWWRWVKRAGIVLLLTTLVPRTAGAKSGVHFAWEDIQTHPLQVLWAPVAGLACLVASRFRRRAKARAGAIFALAGVVPLLLGVLDRRAGVSETSFFTGAVVAAACVLAHPELPGSKPVRFGPLAGVALVFAAYLIPFSGTVPIGAIFDVVSSGKPLTGIAYARIVGVFMLLPLALALGAALAIFRAVRERSSPAVSIGQGLLLAAPVSLVAFAFLVLSANRADWVGWLATAAEVGGALYATSAAIAIAIGSLGNAPMR